MKVKGEEEPVLIQTGVRGRLIEINPKIAEDPGLLISEEY